jgi:RHS repeat-associated protein
MTCDYDRFSVLAVLALSLLAPIPPAAAFDTPPWDTGHQGFDAQESDGEKDNPPPDDNPCHRGDPVNVAVGDTVQTYIDIAIPGAGPQLALIRTYHCQDRFDGPFGRGWHTNLTVTAISVTDGDQSTVIVRQGDGKRKRFVQNPDGTFQAAPGTYQTLLLHPDGSITLRGRHGDVQEFDADGRTTERGDRNANALRFTYDGTGFLTRVSDDAGRSLTFAKGPDGRIASVTDPLGRTFSYRYDANGDLIAATDPIGAVTGYSYNSDGDLLSVVDPRGNTVVTNTYDDQDRVTRQVFPDGASMQLSYLGDRQTRLTDERGNPTLYQFNDTGNPIQITDPLGRLTRTSWDGNYNRTSFTDARGHTTRYEYDGSGNLIRKTDPLGQESRYSYEPSFNQLASATDPDGFLTTYAYDQQGNLIRITDALGSVTSMSYDTRGLLASTRDPLGNTTRFAYDSAGNLIKTTDPLGQETTMTYDGVGNLLALTDARGDTTSFLYDELNRQIRIVDALGGVSRIQYDGNGNRTRITDPKGNVTTFEYDARNRLSKTTNPLGHTQSRAYDAKGNLVAITDANANTTSYSYDPADQLTVETRPGGATWRYQYDGAGNRTATVDPAGVRTEEDYDALNRSLVRRDSAGEQEVYQYDARGNRIRIERRSAEEEVLFSQSIQYDGRSRAVKRIGGMGQTSVFEYDGNDNLTGVTDPLGRFTHRAFDPLNRVVQIIDAAGAITGFEYDALGNLSGVTDPRGLATSYAYDALGRATTLDSPDTGVAQSSYDANANLIARTDSRGITETRTYDALDRPTAIHYPDPSQERRLRYDEGATGKGRLTGYQDPSGQTDFSYDERGNRIGEERSIQTQSYHLGYRYNGADRLTRIEYPSGLQVTYGYDAQGRIRSIDSDAGVILQNITYLPFGPVAAWSDGSGATRTLSYDASYRMTAISVPGLLELSYRRDEGGNLTALADGLNESRSQSFSYDAANRLTQAAGGYGRIQFTFDPLGNRLSEQDDGQLTRYTYGSENNRLLEASGADVDRFTYDAAGNQIANSDFTSVYSQANRLQEIRRDAATLARYLYNAEGQRVAKTLGPSVRHFVYGRQGQLLGVYDGTTGAALQEILYLGTTPVATLRGGELFFVHTDHLGTPRVISDGAQQILWRWDTDPFGEDTADQDPDGDGQPFAFGLRFPGQYFDGETDRHYNYHRDYNPGTGRYVESDPLGVLGLLLTAKDPIGFDGDGPNLYAYVVSDPVNLIDATGLVTCVLTPRNSLGLGVHSSLYVSGGRYGPIIYDPAGGYATDNNAGSGEVVSDEKANVGDYSNYHRKLGEEVEITCKDTTPEQETKIEENIERQGGAPVGGMCTIMVSNAISGIEAFSGVEPGTFFPGNLANDARR